MKKILLVLALSLLQTRPDRLGLLVWLTKRKPRPFLNSSQ